MFLVICMLFSLTGCSDAFSRLAAIFSKCFSLIVKLQMIPLSFILFKKGIKSLCVKLPILITLSQL